MEPPRVTVRLTARDYAACIGFVTRSTLIKLQLLVGGGALAWWFTTVFTKRPPSVSPRVLPEDLVILAGIIVAVLFLPKAWSAFFGWITALRRSRFALADYEIHDEGLYFKTAAAEGVRAWSAFKRAARKGGASYLLVGPISGFIFPDHAFPTREDAVRFFDQLIAHIKAAGQPVNWQASKPATPPSLDPASVTVQLEVRDIRRFTSFLPGGKWRKAFVWVFVAAMICMLLVQAHFWDAGRSNAGPGVPLFSFFPTYTPALIFLAAMGFSYWRVTRPSAYQKRMPGLFIPRTYTVSDEGLFSKSEEGESITEWQAVQRFAETDTDFYVMIAKRNGYVLPKRCFPTREAAAIFGNQVRLNLEKYAPAALATV